MSQQLSELFDLPQEEPKEIKEEPKEIIPTELLTTIEKIEKSMPVVTGLSAADTEMDSLADMAKESYESLMSLGMQVDPRFSAEIFGVASNMLNHAITAKTVKINTKLKQLDLQLKKMNLDQKAQKTTEEVDNTPIGEGKALDRNELLKLFSTTNDK